MPKTVPLGFDELLTRLALTQPQVDIAVARHTSLKAFLNGRFKLSKEAWLTGSYSRQTIVRQDRDIDIAAGFSVPDYWDKYKGQSSAFVRMVRDIIKAEHYKDSDVSTSGGAIVMNMTVFNVDVARLFIRQGGGFYFADGANGWKPTNPPEHFAVMEKRNKADPRLKPVVKLLKFWSIVNKVGLESFHIEMMVEQMWRSGTITDYPGGMKSTLGALGGWIEAEVRDPWPDGGRIDTYLDSGVRAKAAQMARSDAGTSAEAEQLRAAGKESEAIAKWQTVFRNEFPAYG